MKERKLAFIKLQALHREWQAAGRGGSDSSGGGAAASGRGGSDSSGGGAAAPAQFADGYDENLMGDAADQARLVAMSELQRETELAGRKERRNRMLERQQVAREQAQRRQWQRQQEQRQPAKARQQASSATNKRRRGEEATAAARERGAEKAGGNAAARALEPAAAVVASRGRGMVADGAAARSPVPGDPPSKVSSRIADEYGGASEQQTHTPTRNAGLGRFYKAASSGSTPRMVTVMGRRRSHLSGRGCWR
jgi:hypothetical protein